MKKVAIFLVTVLFLAGCGGASKSLYAMRSHDVKLYEYSKTADTKATLAELDAVIKANPKRVPPGVYAEYGYLLLKQKEAASAVEYFKKEMALYPESAKFMQRMIAIAGGER
ncbi:DUF4810 domain-containing protein [Campylobacter sp. 19-13652]|uniref:DUF4810 domain-containing protein n=1 Tax=Campylobacter sp. 19-13652 TaxID=2840180 RepID=UPI001C747870|nr:DUF4810 domain-containing protein [Campylobacter sp. 19-13652]BCX78928.1 hypothetical protein LBC_03900 [Campylobacter sp. 19-13652]